jgi:LuxR family transcriptional regulator, maltose regulon positive regulatory protein
LLDTDPILLHTKLHRPRLPHNLVLRTRLLEVLDHAFDQPLTLVCAPAGFGKTTLVSTWLERMAAGRSAAADGLPAAWLSLDENDSDLNLFLRYFIAALRTIFADACERTLILLQARQQPPLAVLNATLSNEIEQLPESFILVLDDYQTVRGADVHNLLAELARHWPKPLHLVLISRVDPSIPLSGLRAKGMLSEIRTRDLRFTTEETAAYLSRTQFALMSRDALPLIEERLEGWPAGLHLAAISFRSAASQEAVLSALSGENTNITEYLVDEVLTQQLPVIQTFLLKTSILDRFCAALCEAIIGEMDPAWNARLCLDWIERSEMFIMPLDERREWYRYHHLFQELLQQRLTAEIRADMVKDLHLRASAWLDEHGLTDEALHHTLAAGDFDLAARQIGAGLCEVINLEDRPAMERRLSLVPEAVIQRYPELLMLRAWALEFSWRLDLQAQVIQQIEELLDSDATAALPQSELQTLRGQILTFKAQQAYFSIQPARAIDQCRQALAILPPAWRFARGGAMLFLGLSMQASGQGLAAERLLLDEYETCSDKTDNYALFILEALGLIYLNSGQLEKARKIGKLLLQNASSSSLEINKSWGYYFLGTVHYQRNELGAAEQYFTRINENHFTAQVAVYRDAIAGLAIIHQIQGESADAWRMVESVSQYDLEQRGGEDDRTRSLRAHLMLLQGDLEGASNWLDTFSGPPPDMALLWAEEPQVTRARVLLARGEDSDLQSMLQLLDTLEEIVDRTHNTRIKLELQVLRALALDARGDSSGALDVLKQAVDLARAGGFIRVFTDPGKPMQEMLRRLAEQGYSAEPIRRILDTFPADDGHIAGGTPQAHPERHPASGESALIEPLTPREFEVLTNLRSPLSIKEIALRLNISYATAKRHTINIYGKLGVNQRWEAVAKAEELNILPAR